ncbi:hypothetical protein B0T25DRAFT_527027 [Lasiosphaeria hispida]|uniref:DNA/RNA-binding domain-containing protein n=1 Tax=Lasiosphaeria hispida TaxID=260671 RepID=A0AAJ0MK04_9PEZI|nr:hypothetical protein B0T25DRAFT_527027 [Lasiosphaeria hispida]
MAQEAPKHTKGKEPTKDITQSWTQFLRKTSQASQAFVCPVCQRRFQNGLDSGAFNRHIKETHSRPLDENPTDEAKKAWTESLYKEGQSGGDRNDSKLGNSSLVEATAKPGRIASAGEGNQSSPSPARPSNLKKATAQDPRPASKTQQDQGSVAGRSSERSPASSLKRGSSRSRSQSPPKRSKAAAAAPAGDSRAEFDRGPLQSKNGRLWNPDDDTAQSRPPSYSKDNVATNHRLHARTQRQSHPPPQFPTSRASSQVDDGSTDLIKQPETRPISQEQLVAEVKGIYAGLVMVENKCIEVDNAQNTQGDHNTNKLNNEQWQALIALHRTLLHEHHDFFLASQHPSASPALRRLASKYAMPARMWRHGIHSFLELLRHRLPASLEHMLTFIYLAYSMMALLYETVPTFEDTWIECLGDLGRYRMAIEDDDIRDREVWTAVSRGWYSKASDKAPTTGRLYHHLAILARPNALQQLFYYNKSLCVAIPFASARDSIMTLFEPIMAPNSSQTSRLPPTELAFVKTHGILFSKKTPGGLETSRDDFINSLDNHIGRSSRRFLESSYYIGISNCCALVGYGNDSNPIFSIIKPVRDGEQKDRPMGGTDDAVVEDLSDAIELFNRTHDVMLLRFGDPNVLPYVHVILIFLYHLTFFPEALEYVAPTFPWKLMSQMLNTLISSCPSVSRIETERFPQPEKDDFPRPLPEDYAARGLVWAERYYPNEFFTNDKIEDEEKGLEAASMGEERKIRALFLGYRIANAENAKWLLYDRETHRFSVGPKYDIVLQSVPVISTESIDFGELPDAAAPTDASIASGSSPV